MKNAELYELYLENRDWSDQTIPQGMKILIDQLNIDLDKWKLEETNIFEDTQKCGDIKIFNTDKTYMVGYRCRKEYYMLNYPLDVTLRYLNKFGHKTEFGKIMDGKGDLNLYCFQLNGIIVRWILICFEGFRKAHKLNNETGIYEVHERIKYEINSNKHEDDTDLIAYDMLSIKTYDKLISPENKIIIAHSDGYFEDMYIKETLLYGEKFTSYELKNKEDRIDGA